MMISAHKKNFRNILLSGISLLEVVIAILLIGMLLTFGVTAYNGRANDKNLRVAAIEIESLASRARSLAFLKQSPHRLSITGMNTIELQESSGNSEIRGYVNRDQFSGEVKLSIRRWGAKDDEWLTYNPEKPSSEPLHWYFSPTGLCEPVTIRLMEDQNWILLHMDPLTGRVQEEESYIAKK